MSIVTATAYPSRYAHEPYQVEEREPPIGRFCLHFGLRKAGRAWSGIPSMQRELAWRIGETVGEKLSYDRKGQQYCVGIWHIDRAGIVSEPFDIGQLEEVLLVLERLKAAGYAPDGMVDVHLLPERYDAQLVLNLCNIIEARKDLITRALGLTEEMRIIVGEDLAFGVPLDVFSIETMEACIHLLRQSTIQAATVGKARMKPCDDSNPKFQMRSWLLRLGFIGEEFARPRRTLLQNLEGNGAFFDDQGKERAAARRRAQRMIG